ncbi:MAG: TOBE domain-containing protein, partial [Paracoccus sp. (in: a-proteobacteria)]|nr:TOBE domain-containing protein [Paracoccus sp. (in: a-proteobacteria)]
DPGGTRVLVQLAVGSARILAEITARSAAALDLSVGTPCHAVIKTVALIRQATG